MKKFIDDNSNNKNGSVASGIAFCLYEELSIYYKSVNSAQKLVCIKIHNTEISVLIRIIPSVLFL